MRASRVSIALPTFIALTVFAPVLEAQEPSAETAPAPNAQGLAACALLFKLAQSRMPLEADPEGCGWRPGDPCPAGATCQSARVDGREVAVTAIPDEEGIGWSVNVFVDDLGMCTGTMTEEAHELVRLPSLPWLGDFDGDGRAELVVWSYASYIDWEPVRPEVRHGLPVPQRSDTVLAPHVYELEDNWLVHSPSSGERLYRQLAEAYERDALPRLEERRCGGDPGCERGVELQRLVYRSFRALGDGSVCPTSVFW